MITRRWVPASALAAVAVFFVTLVLLASYNPWHYVRLMPFGRNGVVFSTLALAPLLLLWAVWLVVGNRIARVVVSVLTALLTLGSCAIGWANQSLGDPEPRKITVLGVSPDGRFELVDEYSAVMFFTAVERVRLRSRAGLASRASGQALACFQHQTDDARSPSRVLRSARFVGATEVEVVSGDGVAWRTTFDPGTLVAASTLARGCNG
ncbi:hypothetical protein AB0M46_25095 [Dactylosporangium sp. NPDC051485]|uniref:hypothetical protein n=1 Tax=Dactylosporangium sp. NPDC051485 TaxID=3154846 RepID=UPI0034266109